MKMASRVADSFNLDLTAAVNNLFNLPETMEKIMFPSHTHDTQEARGVSSIPVDILDTPKEYIFFMDVPGLSKSEIQVRISATTGVAPLSALVLSNVVYEGRL